MSDIAIEAQNLSKEFKIGALKKADRHIREVVMDALRAPFRKTRQLMSGHATGAADLDESFWALRDVSFQINHGEVVGLLGKNGAGKSTLLKILSRITEPTRGVVEIHGRVGSLLEVGIGFNLELTGRDNIFLSGAVNGMTNREIKNKFDEIVSFSEVEKFIDTPVKHYSSGMYLRLAFAVAAHLDPEILLVDEVLAVGDLAFQRKCLKKMGDVAKRGRTVLLVSHNMAAIAELCTSAIWLHTGQIRGSGPAEEVISQYLHASAHTSASWERPLNLPKNDKANLLSARVLRADKTPGSIVNFEDEIMVEMQYEVLRPSDGCCLGIMLKNGEGFTVLESRERDTLIRDDTTKAVGNYTAVCTIPGGLLRQGEYYLSIGVWQQIGGWIERREDVLTFEVSEVNCPGTDWRRGIISPRLKWTLSVTADESMCQNVIAR